MGPKRQATKKDPPVGEDDDSMGGSVGSRSSARLKRKRESAAARTSMTGKALQFDAVREEDDHEEEQEQRRTSKRVKKHHVEPFFVGHAASPSKVSSKVEDVEMTVEYIEEENAVEMMESSKPMDVTAKVVTAAVVTTAVATPAAPSVRKSAPTTSAALDRAAAQTQATIPLPPPSQRTPVVPTVPTPSLNSVCATSRAEVPQPAPKVATATDAPAAEDIELAPDVAMPPSATFWRTLGLDRTLGWLVLLLLLQLLLFPLWRQTIWSGTMALSNVLVSIYRWTDSTTAGQRPASTQHELQQAMQTLDQLQSELQTLQQQEAVHYQQWHAIMDAEDSDAAEERTARLALLTTKVQQLQAVKDGDGDVEGLADILEQRDDDRRGPKLLNLAPFQRLLSKLLPPESRNGSDGTCDDKDGSSLNTSLVDAVRSRLNAQMQLWQRNDTALHQRARSWIQRQVQEQVRRWQQALADLEQKKHVADSSRGGTNAPLLGLRRVLEERFQRDGDDERIDYASLLNGGRVVSASPSLVDTLPLLNRLAAFWRLRFYGHGPAVALTPTQGQRLGHCWSMAGDAGQLTIELGRAIQVQSVVVEHIAPTDKAPSALRAFRVFGYESAKDVFANSEGHALGTFEFDYSKAKRGRMEFPVKASPSSNVQFVRLQIDSNWGNPENYTCLYRFRVHGQPVA